MDAKVDSTNIFEFTSTGYGEFNIEVEIFWNRRTGLKTTKVDHMLNFDKTVTKNNYEYEVLESYYNKVTSSGV